MDNSKIVPGQIRIRYNGIGVKNLTRRLKILRFESEWVDGVLRRNGRNVWLCHWLDYEFAVIAYSEEELNNYTYVDPDWLIEQEVKEWLNG